MKGLTVILFILLTTFVGSAQCEFVDVSVSSSTTTSVNLYTPAFFLISPGNANQNHWVVKNMAGSIIHEETTSGAWADQSFSFFNHSTPLTETMEVCLTISNTDTGEICGLCNTLSWLDNISNWVFANNVSGTSLPVELTAFNGLVKNDMIELEWTTASETNNQGFEIEKSSDRSYWKKVGYLNGNGTTSQINKYKTVDRRPFFNANYYRLKQIDLDGTFEYSEVIMVAYIPRKGNVSVFPNPSKGRVSIQINIPSMEKTTIQVFDHLGRIVWASGNIEGESFFMEELELKSSGVYYVATQIGKSIFHDPLVITIRE